MSRLTFGCGRVAPGVQEDRFISPNETGTPVGEHHPGLSSRAAAVGNSMRELELMCYLDLTQAVTPRDRTPGPQAAT
jgi:hypothetical protein